MLSYPPPPPTPQDLCTVKKKVEDKNKRQNILLTGNPLDKTFWIRARNQSYNILIWVCSVTVTFRANRPGLTLVMLNILYTCTTLLPNFYPVYLHHSSCKHVFSSRVENGVDPVQMASLEASWVGSTVFTKRDKPFFSRTSINMTEWFHWFH